MILNDRQKDLDALFKERGLTKRGFSREIGGDASNIIQTTKNRGITPRFIEICEMLGYDIEINYVYRGKNGSK